MVAALAANRFLLDLATWANEQTSPNAGAGTPSALGSLWQQADAISHTVYLKLNATDHGWVRQNLINLNVFNIQAFGAKGDGITDDTASIQAATNAANAAGGGIVYVPPVDINNGKYYRLTKPGSGFGSIQLNGMHNIVFMGDGYASLLAMDGSAAGGDWYAFRIFGGSSRIKLLNIHLDGSRITSPDPGDQNHFIRNDGPCSEIDIVGMWFGPIVGDMVQSISDAPSFVQDVRMIYNAQDADHCRSFCEAQRGTRQVTVAYNWIFGSDDNDIDFEPTGAVTGVAPAEWLVVGNQINHQSRATDCITTSGINSTRPCLRNVFAHNMITNGGQISGLDMIGCTFFGNIVVVNSTQLDGCIQIFRVGEDCTVTGNVAVSDTNFGRAAIELHSNAGTTPTRCQISDNVGNSGESTAISLECPETVVSGNIMFVANAVANTVNGIVDTAVVGDLDHVSMTQNMIIATAAKIGFGINFHAASGFACRNTLATDNWIRNVTTGITWDRATTESFLDWRLGNRNSVVAATAQTIISVPATVGLTIEGSAAPGSQFAWINQAAGPTGAVAAPVGSACTNIAGGPADTFFYKETGAGVSGGTTGWRVDGADEIVMGALSTAIMTTALFLAPGGAGLANAIAAEIQIPIPRAGTIRNLNLQCSAGTGVATVTYTVRKNGADTALKVAAANTASTGSDLVDAFTVVGGDLLSLSVVKSAPPATPQTNVQCSFEITS